MGSREAIGELEHEVLLSLLRLGSESYSVPIVLEIERCTGTEAAPAAVYIALRRLEKRGFLTSRMAEATATSRERRYFKLRPMALERLRASRRNLKRFWDGVEPLLDEK